MLAIGFDEPGGPEVLRAVQVAEPHAGVGQVRIRVAAATVNPSDLVTRGGAAHDRYREVEPPYVPGWDAAGVVDEVGAQSRWRVGDRVVAITKPVLEGGGAYAEWIVVSDDSVAPLPEGADVVAAATLPMNGLTAVEALDVAGVRSGGTIAVTGAAGAVGGYVIQLAKYRGLTVLADASARDARLVADLGADTVLERGDDFARRVSEQVPAGVDGVIDCALLGSAVLPAIRDGGAYVALRPPRLSGTVESERGIDVHYVMVLDRVHDSAGLAELSRLASVGVLTLRVAQTFPATEAAEAHRRLEAGGLRGRIVLTFP
ncbi:NADP-dependent oxidoreductase [Nocardia macrotermitis]|uniref:Zinc-type alcohol dehydrogenase-like protein n=1 Tax=Nocardia macrotermitis TaxID=2585198 RepID=A0A7K0D4D3_9NOCA|nr:NADP-dependent oxidoreductase [Nocardia macrotermitis]MQY20431.1 Zinc-type alcohol dehydrogenase-like protein [Nocardia macrotermitis]